METWKDVLGYEGTYEVSNLGSVRTCAGKITYTRRHGTRMWQQRILKQKVSKDNTHRVSLWLDGKEKTWLVHRLVAYAFHSQIEGKEYVNHIDGNRRNNRADNLEWCNHTENNNHAFDTGLIGTGTRIVLTNDDGERFSFRSMTRAAEFLGRSHGFISNRLARGITTADGYTLTKEEE